MVELFQLILGVLASLFKSRARLEAENLVLRQQVNVLRRQAPKRPQLKNTDDRCLLVWLCVPKTRFCNSSDAVRPAAHAM
jgi:hypothetical protein